MLWNLGLIKLSLRLSLDNTSWLRLCARLVSETGTQLVIPCYYTFELVVPAFAAEFLLASTE